MQQHEMLESPLRLSLSSRIISYFSPSFSSSAITCLQNLVEAL